MNTSGWSGWSESRIERVLVWFLRIVLFFLLVAALLQGDFPRAFVLSVLLAVHGAVYWAVLRLQSSTWGCWAITLTDIVVAGLAFYVGGDVAELGIIVGASVTAVVAARLGLWQALAVNIGIWLLCTWSPIHSWFWSGEQFSPRIVGNLGITLALTWGVNYLASMEARQIRAMQDISLRLRQLSTVYEVGQTVTATLEIDVVLDLVVTKAVELLNAQAGSLLLLDKDTNELVFRIVLGPVSDSLIGQRLPPEEGIAGAAIRTGEGQIVNDVRVDARWYAAPDLATGFETRSVLCVPLICRGRPVGALEVINKLDGTSFDNDDLELLCNFAVQAAVAVENAQLYESTDEVLGRRVRELATIEEIDHELGSTLDYERIISLVLERAIQVCGATSGLIGILGPDQGQLEPLYWQGEQPELAPDGFARGWPVERGVIGLVVRTRESKLVVDIHAERDYEAAFQRTRSAMAVPIKGKECVIGVLNLESDQPAAFNREDLRFMEHLAEHAGIAIENARLHQGTQRRLQELEGQHQISLAISSLTDIRQVYAQISEHIAYLMGAELCGIWLFDLEQQALVGQLPFFGVHDKVIDSYRLPVPDGGMTWKLWQEREYLILNDVANEPLVDEGGLREFAEAAGVRDTIFAPLVVGQQRMGVIQASNKVDGTPFTVDEAQLLCVFAGQAAAVVENARLFEAQEQRLREVGILFETSTAITTSLELEEVLRTVARHMAYALEVSSCTISDWDPARNVVTTLVAEANGADLAATLSTGDVGTSYSLAEYPITAQVLRERRPVVVQVADPDADPAEQALLNEMGQKSVLLMPLETRDRVVGLLELYESRHIREFSLDDIRLCRALANQAAVAIDNARLYEQTDERLRARIDELTALQRTMQELNATLELERILQVVLESAVQTTRATHGNVMLVDSDSGELVLRAAYGYSAPEESAIQDLLLHPNRESITFQVAQSGQAQIVDDATGAPCTVCVRGDTRSALAVPIFYQDAVVGLINLRHTRVRAFEQEDLTFVQALAEQAAIAIGNALRYQEQVRVNNMFRQRTEQLDALLAVSRKLRTDVLLDDTLEEIAYAIQETVGFNIVLISIVEGLQGAAPVLQRVAAAGLPLEVFEEAKRVRQPVERYERILREEYRQGLCYFFPFQKQDDWAAELHTLIPMSEVEEWHDGQWHPRDMLLAPMRGAGGRLLGHISVDEPRDGLRPTQRTMEILAIFANQAAIAVENANLYADARRRADNLTLINDVGQALTQLVEPEQVLDTVVKAVGLLLQCEMGAIFQPDPADGKFAVVASYGTDQAALEDLRFAPGEGLVGHVAAGGTSLVVPDTDQEPRFVQGPVPIGSMMLVPIVAGRQVIGVLTAASPRKHALTEADQVLLTTLADQAAVALESTRLLTGTQQAALRLASLNQMGRRVAAQLELRDMLETTVDALHEYLGYSRVGVFLIDGATSELFAAAANESFRTIIPRGFRQKLGEGLIGAAAATGKTILTNDALSDERYVQVEDWSALASISVPIRVSDKVIGVLEVEADRRGAFTEQDVAALEIAADQLAVAIQNAHLFEQTQRRVAELATINEIGRAISGALDPGQLAGLIYDQVSNLLDTRNFHIAVYDPETESIHVDFLVEHGQRQPPVVLELGQGLTSYLVRSGEPILLTSGVEAFLQEHDLEAERHLAKSWLGVPLVAGDRVVGAIAVQSFDREDAFDAEHLELLTTIAGQASIAFHNASLFQERQQRIEHLNVLNEMAQAISSTLELEELLEVVYQQASRIVDTENFYIALYDEEKNEITFPFVVDPEQREDWGPRKRGEGLTGAVIESGRPLLLPSGAAGLYREAGREVQTGLCRSWLGVPMIAEDRVLGVIAVQDYRREYVYNEEHRRLLSTVAAQAAVAVRNAQLYQQIVRFSSELEGRVEARTRDLERALAELTTERDRVETLYRITSELGATLELERVLQRALRLFADALRLQHGTILLVDQETGRLILRATLESDRQLPRNGEPTEWRTGVGLAGWILEHREPVLIADLGQDPRWVRRPGKELKIRSVLAAPLSLGGGDILGVLTLGHPEVGYFTKEHLQLVTAATGQLAMAVSNSDLYAFITDQADQLGAALQAQQEEAAKNRAILESIADGVLVLHHNGRVLLVNPAAEELLGFAGMALEGQHFRHMLGLGETPVHRELAQALYSELRNRLEAEGDAASAREVRVRLEAGARVLAVNIAPLLVTLGSAPGLVAVLRDISREAEVERLKNEFISTVSHELRTPMTSIKGYTDLLFLGMAGGLTDAQRNFLKIIKSNADRLTALVNDILDISRIETGRMRLNIESLALGEIISQVVASFDEQYREKDLILEWREPGELPQVRGDTARVTQVLSNLIANAWQYTPEGGRVTITVQPMDGFLQVDVSDTGIGISPDDVNRIFDRFYRADHPVVQEAGGTGLGLSIVKMFVEMLGGEIWVESKLGHGSTFSFTLPLSSTELPEPVPDLLSTELAAGISRRPKILVVEDDRDLALLLRRQLESEGYRVLLAGTGEDALWLAREAQPQLITLDIMLPDLDGFSVLEQLKENPATSGIPVVIVSVLTDTEKGYALGAVDYVVKPFEETKLLNAVQNALQTFEDTKPHSVVVADDDPEVLDFLEEALSLHGYQVWTASNGKEALALIHEYQPDLILLDTSMPVMDGYEVIRQLKGNEATRPIPIVMITARPVDKERDRVQVLGMEVNQYVTKPLSVEMLIREIKKAMVERPSA
jgi:PAS domain S-box-containing protein